MGNIAVMWTLALLGEDIKRNNGGSPDWPRGTSDPSGAIDGRGPVVVAGIVYANSGTAFIGGVRALAGWRFRWTENS